MIRIIGNKEQFIPIKEDNGVTINFDYLPMGDTDSIGSWYVHKFTERPTFFRIKNLITNTINNDVKSKIIEFPIILEGQEHIVWLSQENQANYKSAYDLAIQTNGANLPYKVKCDDVYNPWYYEITNVSQFTDFYLQVAAHIKNCVEEGWRRKDNINWEDYKL